MAVKLAEKRDTGSPTGKSRLPRANVRDPANPFPDDQYIRVPNVAIFAEHETRTPGGEPQRFDQQALERLIDRGNERIDVSGDYAAVCVGHTHDPDDPNGAEEQPEVIGAMGPYRLGLLGNPGQRQKYAILADLWIRKDKISKYNAHPRRSVELWYEHDQPAWIDPLSLLTEAPRLDLGLTPLIPAADAGAGGDGAEAGMKYLYAATFDGGLRRVKYAAGFAAPSGSNVFVPAETGAPKHKYAAGGPAAPNNPESKGTDLMLVPEDIRQICDAIEQLDVITAMREFLPQIPKVQELLSREGAEHLAENEPGAVPGEVPGAVPPEAGEIPGAEPPAAPPAAPEPPPAPVTDTTPPATTAAAAAGDKLPEDLHKVKHAAADAGTTGKTEEKKGVPAKDLKLDDMSEDDIERYLCDRKKKKYSVAEGSADGKTTDAPAAGDVDPGKQAPDKGSVTDVQAQPAKYSALEAKVRELEADRITRTNEARKQKLQQLRYHRAFSLDKEVERTTYAKMSDEAFRGHCEFIAEVATPTLANQPMPVPDELLDSAQPPAAVRQGPEKYSKEKCEEAARVVYEKRAAGQSVTYEAVLNALVNGQPVP